MSHSIFRYLSLLLLVLSFVSQAQNVQDDFEGNGTITTWFGDNCGIDLNHPNPFQQGINNSSTVMQYHDTGGQYANVRFDVPGNFDLSVHHTFSLKIFVPSSGLTGSQPNQISLKLQDGRLGQPWVTQSEIIKLISLDQWDTVSFNFEADDYINLDNSSLPPIQRNDFNRVVIQVNGENNNDHVLAYIDDVIYDGTIDEQEETVDEQENIVFDSLVWSDEFDQNGALNPDNWFHQTQLPSGGSWYNGEIQHYTDRQENSFVESGIMNLVARRETFTDQGFTKLYTSARLNSKFTFQYGRIDTRAKLPSGVGTWPAIWMLGKNINEDGAYWDNQGFGTTPWPNCGEIDIMEHWGDNQNFVQSAIHTPSSFGGTVNKGGRTVPTASDEFHLYTLNWYEDRLVFSVDSVDYYTYKPAAKNADTWPFDAEFYMILNVAILSSIEPNFRESALEVDYVRIYQESAKKKEDDEEVGEETEEETEEEEDPGTITALGDLKVVPSPFYPNPVDDQLTLVLKESSQKNLTVTIYDLFGTMMQRNTNPVIDNQVSIQDLGSLPSGLYLVTYTLDGNRHRIKFIKK